MLDKIELMGRNCVQKHVALSLWIFFFYGRRQRVIISRRLTLPWAWQNLNVGWALLCVPQW